MIDGIILIDKEKDITSYDVIRKLKLLTPRGVKIGHAGTLDPFATGLLIVLLGRCTKLMDSIHGLKKRYVVEAQLGFMTDTQDVTGKKIEESDTVVSKEDIEKEIKENFIGKILQTPPAYSANKVNGKRAYDLARAGKEVVLRPKEIAVYEYEILEYNYPYLKCSILCSTGTYIRTLINDLGTNLGCFATATELRRVSIGSFDVSNAISSSQLSESTLESIIAYDNVIERLKNE